MKNDFLENGSRTLKGIWNDLVIGLHRFYLGHFSDYYHQVIIN
jgi:hypothetical protein